MTDNDLHKRRVEASNQSLGLSNNSIYQSVKNVLKQEVKQGLLLDYGAGQGEFLKSLRQDFSFQCHAIDLMKSELENVEWFVHDLNQNSPLPSNTYDVITAIEVIEHLENPRQVVRDFFRLLKKGGKLIMTTPNNESYRSILSYCMRGHFVAFTDSSYPAHITALNRKDLERILKESGFSQIEFSFTNQGMVPKLGGMTWQSLSFGALKGLRFSDNLILTATK